MAITYLDPFHLREFRLTFSNKEWRAILNRRVDIPSVNVSIGKAQEWIPIIWVIYLLGGL